MFRVAAESQSLSFAPTRAESDEAFKARLLKNKTNPDNWGPVFKGKEPVKPATKDTTIEELLSKNSTSRLLLYGHGSPGKSYYVGDRAHVLDPTNVKAAREKLGGKAKLEYVWAYSCYFGSRLKDWSEAFGAQTHGSTDEVVAEYMPVIVFRKKTAGETFRQKWNGTAPFDEQAIVNRFGELIKGLIEYRRYKDQSGKEQLRMLSYEEFTAQWKALMKQYNGVITAAYWHIYDSDFDRKDGEELIWRKFPE